MGFHITDMQLNVLFQTWQTNYHIYAPRNFSGGGRFSDTDCIRYGKIEHADEIVFDKKSDYSFKEVLTPVSQTLFFFTEGQTKEADFPQKGAVIFLRSCDLYALKRLDDMYLHNGPADYYYQHLRDNIKIVLMGCEHSFENCFCVSMGTNVSTKYDMSIDRQPDGTYLVDCKDEAWVKQLVQAGCEQQEVIPAHVTENQVTVQVPENLTAEVAKSTMWEEYNSRCINCGRCNFVCPTCTCFTMQDLFYNENGKVGEREKISVEDQQILQAAAILHDVAIKYCKEHYNGDASQNNQKQVVSILVTRFLESANYLPSYVPKIIELVNCHHDYDKPKNKLLQLLMEADLIVNCYENRPDYKKAEYIKKIFQTDGGKELMALCLKKEME